MLTLSTSIPTGVTFVCVCVCVGVCVPVRVWVWVHVSECVHACECITMPVCVIRIIALLFPSSVCPETPVACVLK